MSAIEVDPASTAPRSQTRILMNANRSPSHNFYSMGKFQGGDQTLVKRPSLTNYLKVRRHNAVPGVSAPRNLRNISKHSSKDLEVKP